MSEPERPQLSPYQVELEAGKRYAWCRCGRSKKQPFCDGSHAGTDIEPFMFTAERTELRSFAAARIPAIRPTATAPICCSNLGHASIMRFTLYAPLALIAMKGRPWRRP